MKDSMPSGVNGTDWTENSAISRTDSSTTPARKRSESDHVQAIQDVVSKYIGQLIHGCGDPLCNETLCDTGRRNMSDRPVRRYTPRSARAVAITLASGPKPRARLCPMYERGNDENPRGKAEGPRDPSAFVQHLSDTATVRGLCSESSGSNTDSTILRLGRHQWDLSGFGRGLQFWHGILDDLSRSFLLRPPRSLEETLKVAAMIADQLFECMKCLISTLPRGRNSEPQWRYVNTLISSGCAYPPRNESVPCDNSYNTWLCILDSLEHGPTFRLLCHLLSVAAEWMRIETMAVVATSPEDHSGCTITTHRAAYGLYRELAARVEDLEISGIISVVVWLKKAFLRHWDGELILKGNIASVSIFLLDHLYEDALEVEETEKGDAFDTIGQTISMPVISRRLDAVELARSYMEQGERHYESEHLFNFSCIFSTNQKATYFRTMNHLRMRKAHSDAEKASSMCSRAALESIDTLPEGRLTYLKEHYLLLNVSRENVLHDTFDQLWQRHRGELLRPLRVRLGEVDEFEFGHDLGGVQIEFFNLVCKEIFNETARKWLRDLQHVPVRLADSVQKCSPPTQRLGSATSARRVCSLYICLSCAGYFLVLLCTTASHSQLALHGLFIALFWTNIANDRVISPMGGRPSRNHWKVS